jgi:hypothetical protein
MKQSNALYYRKALICTLSLSLDSNNFVLNFPLTQPTIFPYNNNFEFTSFIMKNFRLEFKNKKKIIQ